MPSINVSSFNAISNINTCLLNYCIPAQTTAIQSGYCLCGKNAANVAGSAAGNPVGNAAGCAAYWPIYTNSVNNLANAVNVATSHFSNTCFQTYFSIRAKCCLTSQPWCCCYWESIPTLGTVAGGVCVTDCTYWTNGSCCAWTVPAGATYARFQIWGAGAGSHNICCCGMSMWGGSGAYGSVIIPVVPGCVYTLCAGCSYNCTMIEAGIDTGHGCSSFVIGYGLNNFCAEGGEPSAYKWQMRVKNCESCYNGYCVGMNIAEAYTRVPKSTTYGCCICSGGGSCYASQVNMGTYPFTTSCKNVYGLVNNATSMCHVVIGAPGMFMMTSEINAGSGGQGPQAFIHPPIVCFSCCCCCLCMSLTSTCQWGINSKPCTSSSYGCWPGMGGRPNSTAGGCNNCGGGIGTNGLVCVQWTTST